MIKFKRYHESRRLCDNLIHKNDVISAVFIVKMDTIIINEYNTRFIKLYSPKTGKCEKNIDIDDHINPKLQSETNKKTTKKYRITTFNPQIKWKKIIPLKKKIIIPKVKKYIIPRRTTYLVPKKKSVIIPKPVLTQAHIIQNNSIIVPTISIVTPGIEKYPLDNFDGRNRLVSGMVTGAKIYVPKDLEMKRRNNF